MWMAYFCPTGGLLCLTQISCGFLNPRDCWCHLPRIYTTHLPDSPAKIPSVLQSPVQHYFPWEVFPDPCLANKWFTPLRSDNILFQFHLFSLFFFLMCCLSYLLDYKHTKGLEFALLSNLQCLKGLVLFMGQIDELLNWLGTFSIVGDLEWGEGCSFVLVLVWSRPNKIVHFKLAFDSLALFLDLISSCGTDSGILIKWESDHREDASPVP